MKKILKHKILLILSFFIFLIFISNISSYGFDSITIENEDIILSDYLKQFNYYIIQKRYNSFFNNYNYLFAFCNEPMYVVPSVNTVGYTAYRIYCNSYTSSGGIYGNGKISFMSTKSTDSFSLFKSYLSNATEDSCTHADRCLDSGFFNADYTSNTEIISSNFSVKTQEGSTIYTPSDNFNITLSNTSSTNSPIIAYSNYFKYEDAKKYRCYISTDAEKWTLMNYETFNDTINNVTKFRFNYKIFKNGSYYFKLLNTETNKEKYLTVNVTNILNNSSNSGYNKYGIPQPFCTYDRFNEQFIIKTQNFTLDDIKKYECLYIKDSNFSSDYSSWNKMSIGTYNNVQLNQTEYYFFFTVPKNSENCIYYFVFYDYSQDKYGSPSSMNCDFAAMNEYCDNVSGVEKEKKNNFDELIDYFKDRFGFLTYPFEFIADLFTRILNIQYGEPIIHIPKLYIPTNNQKIFNGLDYNLNTILDNSAIKNIYNIYLIAVDFIIVLGVIVLAKNTIMEVFGNG